MAIEKHFETGEAPNLLIEEIHGNMQVRGWNEPRVMVSGNGSDYHFSQEGNEVRLNDFDDCRIFVPVGATLTLGEIHGNAQISGVRGEITVAQIHGNLHGDALGTTQLGRVRGNCTLHEVKGNVQLELCDGNCIVREVEGTVTIGRVRGNLSMNDATLLTAESVSGNLSVKSLQGNVQVRKVGGNLAVYAVMGDLYAESVGGDLKVREIMGRVHAHVGGNAKLDLQDLPIPFVTVNAGGDIRCRVPLEVDAQANLRAGDEIVIKNLELPDEWSARQADFTLGHGEGKLELKAGNRIKLIGLTSDESAAEWDVDFEFQYQSDFNERAADLVQQVAEQVEGQVEAFTRQLNERLAQLDTGDAIAAKVQLKVQSAMRQAEEKIAEAMRRAERQAERQAERHAAREARQRVHVRAPMPPTPPMPPVWDLRRPSPVNVPPPPPAPAPKPKRNPPSPEERMLVLKMLEEGKISVEQAEQLLAAMGEQ